jgi:hypothetical protein
MVQEQFDRLSADILKYKDHPAIFAWGVGNEAEARGGQPWEAINELAAFIDEVDPYHPTVSILAGSHIDRIKAVKERAPRIDVLAINTYRHYANVAKNVTEAGWEGPYLITEMGNDGTWEAGKTEWGAPLEPGSGEKARLYRERYQSLAADPRCLGIFPFKWGYVPKGTSSWFSLFHADGEPNAVVDVIHRLRRGAWPDHRAPMVGAIRLNGHAAEDSLRVPPGETCTARVDYQHVGEEPLDITWQIKPESKITAAQGAQRVAGAIDEVTFEVLDRHTVRFQAPAERGAYRLHFTGLTAEDKIGTANFPFYVEP